MDSDNIFRMLHHFHQQDPFRSTQDVTEVKMFCFSSNILIDLYIIDQTKTLGKIKQY